MILYTHTHLYIGIMCATVCGKKEKKHINVPTTKTQRPIAYPRAIVGRCEIQPYNIHAVQYIIVYSIIYNIYIVT